MGLPAERSGYTVYGETRHRGEVQELEREGLLWRDTPREIAEAGDVVFTSVPNDSVLQDVASGPDGILAGLAVERSGLTRARSART